MQNVENYYIQALEKELLLRKQKNSSYSMRAFSKSLNVNSGVLSLVLNGKRTPSLEFGEKVAEKLSVDPKGRQHFLDSIVSAQRKRKLQRIPPAIKKYKVNEKALKDLKFKELQNDYYHSVSEWYCFTILEMTRLSEFKSCTKWISKQLGVDELKVKVAIKRLLNLGFLTEENGEYKAVDDQLRLDEMYTATSVARRNKQIQIREKAIESIEEVPIEKRSMTSMTMCIDVDRLPEAKKLISEFNEAMSNLLESGKKDKVYAMEIGLFPLQK
ncbi:MAG: TIGR02147 family protein [Bacteriovoracaceae bacterium]|nr:TIGR02147 family protein [Bacteriovoracaceae bacterium]